MSAGVLAWRRSPSGPEVLLVHPGGPYWRGKDLAAWSIPKGLVDPSEDTLTAARREFLEETGQGIDGDLEPLSPCRTPSGKVVQAFLIEAEIDVAGLKSNLFELEWPPRSGRLQSFPEVDKAAYFDAATAMQKIHKGQRPILLEAFGRLAGQGVGSNRS